jgi:putative ribosome biogenesis GTPase RsgA
MDYTVEAVQNEMQKKLTLQDEKVSPGIGLKRTGEQEPRALVIAGPSGVGKGTLIEV